MHIAAGRAPRAPSRAQARRPPGWPTRRARALAQRTPAPPPAALDPGQRGGPRRPVPGARRPASTTKVRRRSPGHPASLAARALGREEGSLVSQPARPATAPATRSPAQAPAPGLVATQRTQRRRAHPQPSRARRTAHVHGRTTHEPRHQQGCRPGIDVRPERRQTRSRCSPGRSRDHHTAQYRPEDESPPAFRPLFPAGPIAHVPPRDVMRVKASFLNAAKDALTSEPLPPGAATRRHRSRPPADERDLEFPDRPRARAPRRSPASPSGGDGSPCG